MRLTELFDKPYPINWIQRSEEGWQAEANVADGGFVHVNFNPLTRDGAEWEINFHRDGTESFNATGTGDEIKIFSTVVAAVKEWYAEISKQGWPDEPLRAIEFTAKKDSSETSNSRVRLYDRFAKQFASQIKMTVHRNERTDYVEWTLKKPKKKKVREVTVDNRNGRGATPNNAEIDYFGMRVKMRPTTFIKLAAPLGRDQAKQEMIDYIKDGGAIGAPFLIINVDGDNIDVTGHEGRNRMLAVYAAEGDDPIETHLFFRGDISRARQLTPEIVQKIKAGMSQENTGKSVPGPLWEDGKIVKGVNTTVDVKTGETKRQAAKFGNKVNSKNEPPLLNAKARKNSSPHVLSNLGLAESIQTFTLTRNSVDEMVNENSNQNELQGWLSSLEELMEDIDDRSQMNQSKEENTELMKDYRACHAVQNVIRNNLIAIRNDRLKNNIFQYDIDPENDVWGGIHAQIQGEVAEIKWIGSYNSSGRSLINNIKPELKARGVKKLKLVAKWESEGFYTKMNFKKDGDTKTDPISGTTHTDMSKGIDEAAYPIADYNDWYGDRQYKEQGAKLVMMTPDEYLSKVRPLTMDDESVENIDILAQHIQDGGTLDPLKLYPDGKEDGRHRAYAAKKLGIKEVPVITWPQEIDENSGELAQLQAQLKQKHNLKDLWLSDMDTRDAFEISSIIVNKDEQRSGTGTAVMQELVNYADQAGKIVVLDPALKDKNHGTTSQSRLRKFYKRFGFIENKGRNKNYVFRNAMIRYPQNMNEAEIKKPHPSDTLGVDRGDMPQVASEHYPTLMQYLKSHGASIVQGEVPANTLKAVQHEFSDEGVAKMMNKATNSKGTTRKKPLLVSADNYIIDGHHRWLASYNLGETVPIFKFSIPVKELLQLVRDFKHTTYKDIYNENMHQLSMMERACIEGGHAYEPELDENISILGTKQHKEERKKKLRPGTEAWFKHWFARPHLTREDIELMKSELHETLQETKHEKETRNRRIDTN